MFDIRGGFGAFGTVAGELATCRVLVEYRSTAKGRVGGEASGPEGRDVCGGTTCRAPPVTFSVVVEAHAVAVGVGVRAVVTGFCPRAWVDREVAVGADSVGGGGIIVREFRSPARTFPGTFVAEDGAEGDRGNGFAGTCCTSCEESLGVVRFES